LSLEQQPPRDARTPSAPPPVAAAAQATIPLTPRLATHVNYLLLMRDTCNALVGMRVYPPPPNVHHNCCFASDAATASAVIVALGTAFRDVVVNGSILVWASVVGSVNYINTHARGIALLTRPARRQSLA
jgi:hypothetical protein